MVPVLVYSWFVNLWFLFPGSYQILVVFTFYFLFCYHLEVFSMFLCNFPVVPFPGSLVVQFPGSVLACLVFPVVPFP